ncbi:ATP-dependent Clp protease proteolytic subunit [Fibrobacterota bacterium]
MTDLNTKKSNEKDKKDDHSLEKEIHESFIKGRKIFLWKPVEDEEAEKIVKQLLYLDSQNHNDITFFINSPGGVITAGLAVYDCMQAIESKVATVVCGQAASMGAVLSAGGAKGKRHAWPRARIMIHQPLISGHVYGPASDINIQAEEMLRIRNELNEILSKHTGKSTKQIEEDTERDNFMTSEEAKKYGLIDIIDSKT